MSDTEAAALLARVAELERLVAILMDVTTRMATTLDKLRHQSEGEP
jgi:hypothetical protein